jgi:hypothetical protein
MEIVMLGGEHGVMTLRKPAMAAASALQPPAPAQAERRITAADFWAMVDPDSEPKRRPASR